MEYTLLSNRSRREIMVLYFIIGKKETTLNSISQFLNVSIRLTKETIIHINEHFYTFFNYPEFIYSSNFGVVKVNAKYEFHALSDINRLKLLLLKENLLFKLCFLLTTNSSISRHELLNQLFISETYLGKQIKQLKSFLISFGLNIEVFNGVYNLKGPEPLVRIFTFVFLFDSFQDVEWPFKNLSPKEIENSFTDSLLLNINKKGKSERLAIYFLISIFHLRTSSGNSINTYRSINEEQTLSNFYNLTKEFQFDIHSILSSSLINESVIESHYLIFLACISTSDMIEMSLKSQIGKAFLNSGSTFILTKDIIDNNFSIISQNVSDSLLSLVSYHLTVAIISSYILEDTTQNFLFLLSSFHPTYLDLDVEFIESFQKNNANIQMGKNQLLLISRLLYSIYNSNLQTSLYIYIQMSRDLSASFNIISRIEGVFNTQNIRITNNISDADVIVTDIFEGIDKQMKNIIYLDSINNRSVWKELLSNILQMYLEKQNSERENYLKSLF